MWNDSAGHGVKERLLGVANCVTVVVPFFAFIGFGLVADKVSERRHRSTLRPTS